jgi:hypothetical protein
MTANISYPFLTVKHIYGHIPLYNRALFSLILIETTKKIGDGNDKEE